MQTYMFEVYYKAPIDKDREQRIADALRPLDGVLDYHEEAAVGAEGPVVLTFEFPSLELAERGASVVRAMGEHVEGPQPYG